MNTVEVIAAVLGACATIIGSLIAATWHLSNQLGNIRVDVEHVRGKIAEREKQVDAMWNWWTDRPCETRHRASELIPRI